MRQAIDIVIARGNRGWFVDFVDDNGDQHAIDDVTDQGDLYDVNALLWDIRVALSLEGWVPIGDIGIIS